ncbi:SDR family oxidoreductase [Allohahella sp. A8]|uniref:SDR family oxidoreductase n=1 Tax=Allohahella sp. A8 TaxID=3141461 RepID=UPI003A806A0E
MNANDCVVVITGGGAGLGRSMALYLASRKAKLALLDVNEDGLTETAKQCREAGAMDVATFKCNVASESEVESVFGAVVDYFGHIDCLVNNAGVLRDGMLIKAKDGEIVKRMSLAEWQMVIDVNLTGVFLCGREAATHMINAKRPGVIINISSVSRAGNIGQSNYSAAKAGVAAMSVTWAKELARYNIRSMAVAPGFIETDMIRSMKPEALQKMTSQIPLQRMGQPDEIAKTIAFIIENDYLTGRVIEVDGGIRV